MAETQLRVTWWGLCMRAPGVDRAVPTHTAGALPRRSKLRPKGIRGHRSPDAVACRSAPGGWRWHGSTTRAGDPAAGSAPRGVDHDVRPTCRRSVHRPASTGCGRSRSWPCLFYHARFGWATGGFLGVSTFFTLSGFLITSLLVREHLGDDGLDRFAASGRRRFRRLVPASWVTLGAGGRSWRASGGSTPSRSGTCAATCPTALAAGHQLALHHRRPVLRRSSSCAPSPLEHFWSLAVEEQFYVLLSLVVIVRPRWSAISGPVACSRWWSCCPSGRGLRGAAGRHAGRAADRPGLLRHRHPARRDDRSGRCWPGVLGAGRCESRSAGCGRCAGSLGVLGLGVTVWLWTRVTVGSRLALPVGLPAHRGGLRCLISRSCWRGVRAPGLRVAPARCAGRHQLRRVPAALADLPVADARHGSAGRRGRCSRCGWR